MLGSRLKDSTVSVDPATIMNTKAYFTVTRSDVGFQVKGCTRTPTMHDPVLVDKRVCNAMKMVVRQWCFITIHWSKFTLQVEPIFLFLVNPLAKV